MRPLLRARRLHRRLLCSLRRQPLLRPYENLYDHDPPGSPFSANGPDTCWHCEQPFEPLIVAHQE